MVEFNEFEYASLTDVGIRRSHNQDAHAVMPAPDQDHWQQVGHVFLVADGMGAHAVGELASKITVDNLPHIFSKYAQHGAVAALNRAFTETNSSIHTRGKQNREFEGMGTTGTALVLRPEGAWVGHVGDSRAYRVRGGVIEQLSFDHSLLWELARRQRKNPDELTGIPSNVIVRSLGPEASVQIDIEGPHPIEPGDVYLLCSDGLSGQVNDRVIGAVLSALPPEEAAQFLVHMANLQGGPDNTTVIVVRVGGEPPETFQDSRADVVFPISEKALSRVPRLDLLMVSLSVLLGRVPWALVLLSLGILMAGGAFALTVTDADHAIHAFVLAVLLLLSGLVVLVVPMLLQLLRDYRKRPEQSMPAERSLQVYRQTPCPLDAGMVEKLAQACKSLEDNIKEKGWEYSVKAYHDQLRQASALLRQHHDADAFRTQCRAMLLLMDAAHRYRRKDEGFKPMWDRASS